MNVEKPGPGDMEDVGALEPTPAPDKPTGIPIDADPLPGLVSEIQPFDPVRALPRHVCIGCGACCETYRIAFHWSETTDFDQGTVPLELTEPLRLHEVAMRGTSASRPRCIALIGQPGFDRRCGIHGRHPSCCRTVQVGDDQCMRSRAAWNLPTLNAAAITQARRVIGPEGPPADGGAQG